MSVISEPTTSAPRLTLGRTLLYSMASAGLNILSITVGTWLLYFYAPPPDSGRPVYLPVTLVGVLLTLGSLWDAVIDPFIGHWSDTLKSRWGRRRPFLLFGAPVLALMTVLLWTPPGGGNTWLTAAYFMLVTVAFFTAFSLVGIPYDGTLPEMAPESRPRVALSYWKNVFGLAGVLVGSLAAAPLFESAGALAMGAVIGVVGLATIWASLLGLRESKRPVGEPLGALAGVRITLQNSQFLYVFISTLFVHIAYQMVLANLPYFVTLVMGRGEADVAIFQGVIIIAMALTGPLWALWNKRLSQRTLLNISMIGLAVSLALGYLVGALPGIPLMAQGLVVLALAGVTLGGYFIVIYAMMGNVVDYDEMLTGRRREAIYYGTFSFALGLGVSVGSLVLPLVLDAFGYTKADPLGVRLAFPVMALFMLAGYLVFQKYRLGDTPQETRRNLGIEAGGND
jgi:GPH family glycoside/pentoside/hexuronide:cation symporter